MTLLPPVTIPPELFRLILNNIDDRRTLCNLCLSSSIMLLEAQRILYRSFTWVAANRQLQFLVTVRENPRLAALVRCYRFTTYAFQPLPAILPSIGPAFQNMVNLKELSVSIHSRWADAFPWDKCTFQLRRLRWMEQDEDSDNVVRSAFTQWLTTQQDLLHLDWLCRRRISVLPSACPNLLSLRGTQKAVYSLLPGRNIMILHGMSILGRGRDDLLDYEALSPEITRLRSLSMQNFFQFDDYTILVEKHLQSLEFLEVFELYQFEDGVSLRLPPNIKVLVFSLRPLPNVQSKYTSIEENIALLFERCRQLRQIDVAQPISNEVHCYRRWIRNHAGDVQEETRIIPIEEVVRGRVDSIEWSEHSCTVPQEIQMESSSDSDWG